MVKPESGDVTGQGAKVIRHRDTERGNQDTGILAIITMEVLAEKRKEFLQAIRGVMVATGKMMGCLSQHLFRDEDNERRFTLLCEWETVAHFHEHIQSDLFGVLLGTATLLAEPPEVKIKGVSYTQGMEAIDRARGGRRPWQTGM